MVADIWYAEHDDALISGDRLLQSFRVLAIGHDRQEQVRPILGHYHERYIQEKVPFSVIQLTLSGAATFIDGSGESIHVGAGQGWCVEFPGAFQYARSETAQHWESVWITITGDLGLEATRTLRSQSGYLLRGGLAPAIQRIQGLLQIARGGAEIADVHGGAWAILHMLSNEQAPGDRQHSAPIRRALALVRRRIDDAHLQVGDLAQAAGLSPAHFSRVFKQEVGEAPLVHIAGRRLRRAQQLLRTTDPRALTIDAIATASGFPSRQRLHELFVRHYGMGPAQWRKNN